MPAKSLCGALRGPCADPTPDTAQRSAAPDEAAPSRPARYRQPLFSIVTVVRNDKPGLERTLKSIFSQTYTNFELLVIDGGSSDGTLSVIEQSAEKIDYWVTEKDDGIYDAMNKGLHRASGDFVYFINAGDSVYSPRTLERLARLADTGTDVLFGEVVLVSQSLEQIGTRSRITTHKLPKHLSWSDFRYGMVVCHQGFIARRSIVGDYISGNLSADIDWVISALRRSRKNVYYDAPIAEFPLGGMSQKHLYRSMWGRFRILGSHYGWIANIGNHIIIVLRALLFRTSVTREAKTARRDFDSKRSTTRN